MVHPEPSRIRAVCRVLERMYPYESREGCGVDMTEERVSVRSLLKSLFKPSTWGGHYGFRRKYKCGTVHCFAGWYFLGLYWGGETETLSKDVYYESGKQELNQALGVPGFRFHLWASTFEKLWGNRYGQDVFRRKCAFGVEEDEEITLKKIVTHLEGVADRIEADRIKVDRIEEELKRIEEETKRMEEERENGASGTE